MEPFLALCVSCFTVLNWGEGLLVGLPAREAVGFVAAAELAGWRLKPLGGVEVPPCALYKPRLWPFPERLWRGEVVAVARSAGKYLRSFCEVHAVQIEEVLLKLPTSGRASRSYASAYEWGVVFRCATFTVPAARASARYKNQAPQATGVLDLEPLETEEP
jgi:hypothetical protein